MTDAVNLPVAVLEVAGSPDERGGAIGARMGARIARLLDAWGDDVDRRTGLDLVTFCRRFLERTDYLPAITRWTPALLAEVRATAEAAGVEHDVLLVAQLVDETWIHGGDVGGAPGGPAPDDRHHCSAVGWTDGDSTVIAQNMDLEAFRDGTQLVVLHRPDDGPDVAVLTSAGVLAYNGLNAAGVGVCVNSIRLASARSGLPVAFVIRGALACGSIDAAEAFLRAVPHASGQNYVLGGPKRIVDLECGADGVHEVPFTDGVVLHTNHALVAPETDAGPGRVVESLRASSLARLEALEASLGGGRRPTLDATLAVLRAADHVEHPVCRPVGSGPVSTFASTVMELAPSPRLHVAPGGATGQRFTCVASL